MKTEDYSPILESAGIRPTSTRLLIYEAIARNSDTFSLSTLERQLDSIDKSEKKPAKKATKKTAKK